MMGKVKRSTGWVRMRKAAARKRIEDQPETPEKPMVYWSYSLTRWRQRKKSAVPMRSSAALVCQGRATDQCWIRAVCGVPVREIFSGLIAVVICSSAVASLLIEFTEEVAGVLGGVAGDGCEGGRGVVEKFGGQDVEGRGVVHVVPSGQG